MIPAIGFSITANTLVSNAIGAGRIDQVIPIIKKITRISVWVTLCIILVSTPLARPIIRVFTADPDLVNNTLASFYVLMGVMIFFSITNVIFNGVSGTANTQIALLFEAVTLVFYLTTAYILAVHLHLPVALVWLSELAYFIVLGTLSIFYLKYGNWRDKKI
jgi:Na+-driven multidrug efflux pump